MNFDDLYILAPIKLKNIVDTTKCVEQNPIWHPEIFVYEHIRYVTNRLHNSYNDINLDLAGFFHDLGKAEVTKWNGKTWTAAGHEDVSTDIVISFKDWITDMGGDVNIIEYIVKNHMRIKYLHEIRLPNKIKLFDHPYFEYLIKFNSADFGGTNLSCESFDMSYHMNEISEYKIRVEENKLISAKFNGGFIIEKYRISGKELSNIITEFKLYIEKKFNINFRNYALSNVNVMDEFDLYYKNI